MLAGALFDLDGTLVDTFAICYLAFRRAVERSGGRALSDAEVHALFGPSEDGMMQRVLPAGWRDALTLYFEEYDRLLPTCPPVIAGVGSALELLRRRKILYLGKRQEPPADARGERRVPRMAFMSPMVQSIRR